MNIQIHAVFSRANDPGVLYSGTIRSTRNLIYTRTGYMNISQSKNKYESEKAKAKPQSIENNLTGVQFCNEYNDPLNTGQTFIFAKLRYRFFWDVCTGLPSILLTILPPEEPEKPMGTPESCFQAIGLIDDTLAPKQTKKGALTVRAGKIARLRISKDTSGYQIVDDNLQCP